MCSSNKKRMNLRSFKWWHYIIFYLHCFCGPLNLWLWDSSLDSVRWTFWILNIYQYISPCNFQFNFFLCFLLRIHFKQERELWRFFWYCSWNFHWFHRSTIFNRTVKLMEKQNAFVGRGKYLESLSESGMVMSCLLHLTNFMKTIQTKKSLIKFTYFLVPSANVHRTKIFVNIWAK